MDLTITEHVIRTVVVALQQRLDAFSAPELRTHMNQLLESGVRRFVIDLSDVPFLDSAGLAALVSLLKHARQDGGDVRLVWPTQEGARRILHLTKFDRVFSMSESVATALSDF